MRAMGRVIEKSQEFVGDVGFGEAIDQLAMGTCVCWYCGVLRREDGHVFRNEQEFEVDG